MRVSPHYLIASGLLALAAAACAPPSDGEPGLISDREISELQQERVPPGAGTHAGRLREDVLTCGWPGASFAQNEQRGLTTIDWSGSLSVDQGTVQLSHLTYFEGGDHPVAQNESNRISWVSQTTSHFDGSNT